MDFYSEISKYYDEIFPADRDEMAFINGLLGDKFRLLDIGCGTGNKTVLLSRPNNFVLGVDADAEMIAQAGSRHAAAGVAYDVADMRNLGATLGSQLFDGVLCLGNTLVHLESPAAINNFINNVYGLMQTGGLFIIQILHYEWIIADRLRYLPVTDTPNVKFEREYVWVNGELHFKTILTDKITGDVFNNDIVLYPLLTTDLKAMLEKCGFCDIRHLGGYDGSPLLDESFVSITVCCKQP